MNLERPNPVPVISPAPRAAGRPCTDGGARELRRLAWIRAGGVVGFAAATAVAAQVYIPLPHTPVPITLQTLVVMLAGVTLGARLGTVSMLFYLLLGAAGYYVFAGGAWGLAVLGGPTGGYLVGFVLAQPVLGALSRPVRARASGALRARTGPGAGWIRLLVALLAGQLVIFACGLTWLHLWSGGSVVDTLKLGLIPFLPGMVIKTAAALGAAGALGRRWRAVFEGPRESVERAGGRSSDAY